MLLQGSKHMPGVVCQHEGAAHPAASACRTLQKLSLLGIVSELAIARRAASTCLLWSVNVRELLTLLRAHPQWYVKAAAQACPGVTFDYLTVVRLAFSRVLMIALGW